MEERKESNALEVKLDVFEGPLDLLLHLIKKFEIDIYDIPIAMITDQYMTYLRAMKEQQLEVAGHYFVVAATLMAIKSKMLIPIEEVQLEEDEEYEDPRQELVNQLLEYQQYKAIAEQLDKKQEDQMKCYTREPFDINVYQPEAELLQEGEITMDEMMQALQALLHRQQTQSPTARVTKERYSVHSQMDYIEVQLTQQSSLSFESLLQEYSRPEIVFTFLAVLELMKLDKIAVTQVTVYGEIMIKKREDSGDDA